MKEPKSLNGVCEFHRLFDLPVIDLPSIPSKERCQLRINLLQEELNELKEALETHDLVEVADACADLQYVLSGAILEFGLGDRFDKLFNEVQRSNMSKACKSMAVAEATVKHYYDKDGTVAYIKPKGDLYLVYREDDDKVLKSIDYSPADINSLLQ